MTELKDVVHEPRLLEPDDLPLTAEEIVWDKTPLGAWGASRELSP